MYVKRKFSMFSNQLVDLRKKLRQVIADTLPDYTTDNIYDRLKGRFNTNLTQQDLIPFCKAVGIPVKMLPNILSPYGIRENWISKKNWKIFYEDEFCSTFPVLPIPSTLSNYQIEILTRFANSIRSRTDGSLSSQWVFVSNRNPTGADPSKIRLSSFCHIVDELDLVFKPKELIDSILAFYGQKLVEIDFMQFASFMQTFN
ncbi:hypothetical protein TRFO_10985 [Tritrichomonas foetus]|uniref:Uncharacterized protein n=1 Tax=Tritrichomonas foetus TaxID=1144522 RepID=A0A1J4JBI9_9EUKA|nr:hypothetical protein TRFO_10985 [Tritrichomonas foetus]|eukprot:OHS94612.1 hypothetical protein TRFO_10985 [Tritrichomonas foetus]